MRFRNYTAEAGITKDYHEVREFFIKLGYAEYTYAGWDWMLTHTYLDKASVGNIGLWEDGGIVGVATFDVEMGEAFCLTLPGYSFLKKEMLLYAKEHLEKDGKFGIIVMDDDHPFEDIATELGFVGTDQKQSDAIFTIDKTPTGYTLPEGFRMTTMQDTYDLYQYRRVLYRGFNHELCGEGAFQFPENKRGQAEREMNRPNVDLNLKVAVVAPNGDFVCYCGMWFDPKAGFAVVEPVATDPDYRRRGLAKAAVLEGIRRVGLSGAKNAIVGSSQQFYYSIGFRPYTTATIWRQR